MPLERRHVRVYRSSRREETYLFVDAADDLRRVPAPLLERFGKPVEALSLLLDPARRLARADARRVLESIHEQGYYLQMPPVPEVTAGKEPHA